jgi:hypothetical protein
MVDIVDYNIGHSVTLNPLIVVDMLQALTALTFKLDPGLCCFVQVMLIISNSKEMYEHALEVRRRNEPVCIEVADIRDQPIHDVLALKKCRDKSLKINKGNRIPKEVFQERALPYSS